MDWSETELICEDEEWSIPLTAGVTSELPIEEGVKTLVSAKDPDHSSLSQSSGDGKVSPHPSTREKHIREIQF